MIPLASSSYTVQPFSFHGRGADYFGLWLKNTLLMVVTLGLYYPWARAARLRFEVGNLELDGSRFAFHGTGTEMFRGFLVLWGIGFGFYALNLYAVYTKQQWLSGLLLLALLVTIPALLGRLIHGAIRYRAARTSWRGLRFGYDGSAGELTLLCLKGIFLTVITFGIYSFWFRAAIQRYALGHLRYGTVRFGYRGQGGDLFVMALVASLLYLPTLGIYLIEYLRKRTTYFFNNIHLIDAAPTTDGALPGTASVHAYYRFVPFFGLVITNLLLIVCTLGLGLPWVTMRSWRFIVDDLTLAGDLDLTRIGRGAETDATATADVFLDAAGLEGALDIGGMGLI